MSDFEYIEGTRAELIAELETIKTQELAEGYTEEEEGDLTETINHLQSLPDGTYRVYNHDMGLVVEGVE